MNTLPCLDLQSLQIAYKNNDFTPVELLHRVLDVARNTSDGVWISLVTTEQIDEQLCELAERDIETLPLYGVPFAVKDNIDARGFDTTAGCEAFRYTPKNDAFVVKLLRDAGAILIGKTNLDQFATGLNGTRSPFGVCRNVLDVNFIAGGSSSGSAVAVALGIVSFALGTDTAGSGRVPASLNNVVGLKPTRGVWSMSGVVPACRSLDTVSVFALDCADAETVFDTLSVLDTEDSCARAAIQNGLDFSSLPSWKLGVPDTKSLQFFGDENAAQLFAEAQDAAKSLNAEIVEIDFAPFLEAAKLLYQGPWVAERFGVVRELLQKNPAAFLEVTRKILARGEDFSAVEVFNAQEKLAALKKICDVNWKQVDAILTPTNARAFTVEEMLADPILLNSELGFYTNFMNLLDYSALALPSGFRKNGVPFGVTVFAPAHQDIPLLCFGARWQKTRNSKLGATDYALPDDESSTRNTTLTAWKGAVSVAVCGAHMSSFPLNTQLTERGAKLVAQTRSAPIYKFYALPGGPPFRPGMVRVESGGASIEVEVWSVPMREYGSFVAGIPAPLGIGTVELEDGHSVQGFVCEAIAANGAKDITHLGSWRVFMAQKTA